MTSKVLVKLPVVPFSQRKKPPPEIISLSSGGSSSNGGSGSGKSEEDSGEEDAKLQTGQQGDKVTQLEQNMKFLQDQHQLTLVSLHQEVEVLRQRNRDLQFQLVFSKGNCSTPSSPEDNANGGYTKTKQGGSPANVNVAPLQVEILEKELQDLKVSLSESKARNIYSVEVIEKQKQKLEFFEKSREKQKDIGVQVDCLLECQQVELRARLDDAEALVRRLRLENEEQRKEITSLKSATSFVHAGSNSSNCSNGHNNHNGGGGGGNGNNRNGGGNNASSGRSNNRHGSSSSSSQNSYHSNNRGSGGNNDSGHHHQQQQQQQPQQQQQQQQSQQDDSYHKFPPLQTQSYWHRQNRSHGYDHNSQSDYHRNNRHNNHQQLQQQHPHQQTQRSDQENDLDGPVLPQLQNGNLRVDNSSYPPFFRPRNNHHNNAANNGNYYKEERNSGGGGNRKYRGHQKSQRDRQQQQRDQDSREYHPRPQQQQQHHQQQREYCDSAKSGRNSQQRQ